MHEALTIATLAPFARVAKGDMVATVKVIPYAAPESAVAAGREARRAASAWPRSGRRRWRSFPRTFAGMKPALLDKNRSALEARLAPLGGTLVFEARVEHRADAVAAELEKAKDADLLFVFGASAISDRRDVVPAAIEAAGGTVEHFGMPVDPGNLLLMGTLNGKPVVGLPGCARSPKLNGFDFVLWRLFAGAPGHRRRAYPAWASAGFSPTSRRVRSRARPRPSRRRAREDRGPGAGRRHLVAHGREQAHRRIGRASPSSAERWKRRLRATPMRSSVVTGHDAAAMKGPLTGLKITVRP